MKNGIDPEELMKRAQANESATRADVEKAMRELRDIVGEDAAKAILTVVSKMSAYDSAIDRVSDMDSFLMQNGGR